MTLTKLVIVFEFIWLAILSYLLSAGCPTLEILFLFAAGAICLIFIWLALMVSSIARFKVWREVCRYHLRQSRRWIIEPLLLTLAVVMFMTNAPFHARFRLSQSALREYAEQLLAAAGPEAGKRVSVGLFTVEGMTVTSNVVHLSLGWCGILSLCGVAYSPSGEPSVEGYAYQRLDDHWWWWQHSL